MNDLSIKIRDLRKHQALTQAQLARRVGITQAFLAEIEGGRKRPSIEVLEKLCDTLGCSADYLLGITKVSDLKTLEQSSPSPQRRGLSQQMLDEIAKRNLSEDELRLAIKLAVAMKDDKNSP